MLQAINCECMMQGEMLKQRSFDHNFYNTDLYIWRWLQFVYQSQLLLAERKQKRKAETHKTIPCQAWKDTGRCNYGKRCKFAHGEEELRPMPKAEVKIFNNPRYRTALCVKYTTLGYCPYGDQCHFIHDPVQIDLEKCLDWLSGSSLSSSQPISEQTNDYLADTSFSRIESETMHLEKRKRSKLTSESECSKKKPGICRDRRPATSIEPMKGNNTVEAKITHDPFRSGNDCNEEIELKPLRFNAIDDFLYVINSQSVLPAKQ
ncbi:unnamed protein product [Litomosoides sigmodontis]|uniref:C3H1-type domain-containing protein n=1 Tax=Litomosoides sigmodontis TaxID=42156 RepID=A0A3P6SZN3_LITSI|nr:unnamed protein product [Litomosoides sigmodontis]